MRAPVQVAVTGHLVVATSRRDPLAGKSSRGEPTRAPLHGGRQRFLQFGATCRMVGMTTHLRCHLCHLADARRCACVLH
jgi:hypothetical protein